MDDGEEAAEQEGGGGFDAEVLKSYLNFVRRSLRARRLMIVLVLAVGLMLTVAVYKYLPRTYTSQTVLMVDSSQVLEGNWGSSSLNGAETLIMRHENLEQIVRDVDLIRKYQASRPPILALKDKIIYATLGRPDENVMMAILRGTLESKLTAKVEQGTLTVSIDWFDPKTAAEIVEAARESYVKTRHVAEMSAFEEKLTILDGHASSLRGEIESLVKQSRALVQETSAKQAARAAASAAMTGDATASGPLPRARAPSVVANEGPRLREGLDAKRKQLADLEREYEARVQTERRKLDDLKVRLTPIHPEVATQQRRLEAAEQVPSEIALLRSEVHGLEGQVTQNDFLARRGGSASGRSVARGALAPNIDAIPVEAVQLLDTGDIDPALAAQLGSAISKYGGLRDEIRSGRIQFDTAQAAFNFRYKVVVPAEVPGAPTKPKAAMVLGAGFFLSLLTALLLPILAQLRTGMVVERWQVAALQLPVLADLHLPPATGNHESEPPSSARV
jgi:uncharacterized protein involved in exopolysaccharide biosynthesis